MPKDMPETKPANFSYEFFDHVDRIAALLNRQTMRDYGVTASQYVMMAALTKWWIINHGGLATEKEVAANLSACMKQIIPHILARCNVEDAKLNAEGEILQALGGNA